MFCSPVKDLEAGSGRKVLNDRRNTELERNEVLIRARISADKQGLPGEEFGERIAAVREQAAKVAPAYRVLMNRILEKMDQLIWLRSVL